MSVTYGVLRASLRALLMRSHPSRKSLTTSAAALAATVLLQGASFAAVAPYLENFDDDPTTISGSATPTQTGENPGVMTYVESGAPSSGTTISGTGDIVSGSAGGNVLQHAVSASRGSTSTSTSSIVGNAVQIPGVAGSNFRMEMDAVLDTPLTNNPNAANLGFTFLGSSDNLTANEHYRYSILVQLTGSAAGRVQIAETFNNSGSNTTVNHATSTGGTALTFGNDATFHFDLQATYAVQGNPTSPLTIAVTVTSPSSGFSQSVSYTDTTPRTGDYFGIRTGLNVSNAGGTAASAAFEVDYDNFAVIPEPATAGLLLLGLTAMATRRRR